MKTIIEPVTISTTKELFGYRAEMTLFTSVNYYKVTAFSFDAPLQALQRVTDKLFKKIEDQEGTHKAYATFNNLNII